MAGISFRPTGFFAGLCLTALFSAPLHAAERIEVLTYHNHPPFIDEEGAGFSQELLSALDAVAKGRYEFTLKVLPRSRLNFLLQPWLEGRCQPLPAAGCASNWILPWVNPLWGFAGAEPATDWIPLMDDANRLVFAQRQASQSVDVAALTGFDGLTLAGMRGHRYRGLDELVLAGRLARIDGDRERDNLVKVLFGRVDFTLLPESTVDYFLSHDPFFASRASDFAIADPPQQRYVRYAMVPASQPDLSALLRQAGERLVASGVLKRSAQAMR